MIQNWTGPDGVEREVGDKDDAAEIAGINPKTWLRYVLRGATDPPPKPVTIDPKSRRDLWDLAEVRAWHARRPGSGDHQGVGARRRWSGER